jgi:hypothetical protein
MREQRILERTVPFQRGSLMTPSFFHWKGSGLDVSNRPTLFSLRLFIIMNLGWESRCQTDITGVGRFAERIALVCGERDRGMQPTAAAAPCKKPANQPTGPRALTLCRRGSTPARGRASPRNRW